jgi:DNA repair photolyase
MKMITCSTILNKNDATGTTQTRSSLASRNFEIDTVARMRRPSTTRLRFTTTTRKSANHEIHLLVRIEESKKSRPTTDDGKKAS